MMGSGSKIVFEQLPDDDPKRRCPDISKARQHLDWQPRVPLEEGLQKTIDYFVKGPK
jgi:nucleoside-diphosphate-sugar epimerase